MHEKVDSYEEHEILPCFAKSNLISLGARSGEEKRVSLVITLNRLYVFDGDMLIRAQWLTALKGVIF